MEIDSYTMQKKLTQKGSKPTCNGYSYKNFSQKHKEAIQQKISKYFL